MGSNPDELIAAAHAACFTNALSLVLGDAGLKADKLETRAVASLEQQDGGFGITEVALTIEATIPGADDETFQKVAGAAKANCPVSTLLKAHVTLDATLL